MDVDEALAALQSLPGVGPFSAGLILVRGASHPDVFPAAEPRLHAAMRTAYGLAPESSVGGVDGDRRPLATEPIVGQRCSSERLRAGRLSC